MTPLPMHPAAALAAGAGGVLLGLALITGSAGALRRWPAGAIARVLVAAVLGLAALLALANVPAADDWCEAALGRNGWWAAQVSFWQGWSGRPVANALVALPGRLGAPALAAVLVPLAFLVATWIAGWWALLPWLGRRSAAWAASLLLVWWLLAMPSLAHGVYWLSGLLHYDIALPPLLVLAGAMVRAEGWSRTAQAAVGLAAGAVAAGVGETVAAPLMLLAACGILRRRGRWLFLGALLAAAGVMAAMITAPGVQARWRVLEAIPASQPLPPLPMRALACAGAAAADLAGWWLSALGAAVAGILLPLLMRIAAVGSDRRFPWLRVAGIAGVGWAAIAACYLPAFAVLGHRPPWRGRDLACAFAVAAGIALLVPIAAWLRQDRRRWWRWGWSWAGIAVAMVAFAGPDLSRPAGLLVAGGTASLVLGWAAVAVRHRGPGGGLLPRLAWLALPLAALAGGRLAELVGDAAVAGPRWAGAMAVRQQALAAHAGWPGILAVPAIPFDERPVSLLVYEAGADAGHWLNQGWAGWFRVGGMRVDDGDEAGPAAARDPSQVER